MDALSVLGPVVISRIRRTTDFQVFIMEALTVYLSFTAAAWFLGEQSFLFGHAGFLHLAVPTTVTVVALLFCNAYSDLDKSSFSKPILQSAGSVSLAFLGQALIFDMRSSIAVPFRTMLYGSCVSFLLISPIRMFFPPVQRRPKPARPGAFGSLGNQHRFLASSLQQIRESAAKIQNEPKLNLVLVIAAALVAAGFLLARTWRAS